MTLYHIQGPDGKVVVLNGPANATAEQLSAALGQQSDAPPPPPPSGNGSAFDTSGVLGGIYAGAHNLEDVATFGQGDKLAAGLSTAINGKGYNENLARIQATNASAQQDHPYLGYLGDAAGLAAGGGVVKAGLRAAKALPIVGRAAAAAEAAIAPKTGQGIRNLVKSVGTNAAIGGGVALANGATLPQAGESAAVSGVAGPVVGKLADVAMRKVAPVAQKAALLLAKHLNEDPADVQAAIDLHNQQTDSHTGSMAAVANLHSEGQLKGLAQRAPLVGEAASKAASRTPGPLAAQTAPVPAGQTPQTLKGLEDVRDANMTDAMDPIRATPVPLSANDKAILQGPEVTRALKANTKVLGNAGLMAKIANNTLTLDDVEQVREAVRNTQDVYANPNYSSHDRQLSKRFGDVANKVEGIGTSVEPQYGAALQNFRDDSRYIQGFTHGASGKPVGAATGFTSASLDTPRGQQGYEHGLAQFAASKRLSNISPGSIKGETEFGAHHAAQLAAGAASAPGPWQVLHFMQAIPGARIPEKAQQIIAKQLFSSDPAIVRQGVANLRRGQVRDNDIRRMGAAIGGVTGANIARLLNPPGQNQ